MLGSEGEWEGAAVLREIPSPTGLYLCGTLRDVMLWLLLPAERRKRAFSPGARAVRARQLPNDAPRDLAGHLTLLLGICDGSIGPEQVSAVCVAVASWARANGALQTELDYWQAAALAAPEDAVLALTTATLASDQGELGRAETWYRRTIKLARVKKEWDTYVRAYLGLGTMYNSQENGPAAKAVMERALKAALRWRLRDLAGEAHHHLFYVWTGFGNLRRAYEHAASARKHYGEGHPLLGRLTADVDAVQALAQTLRSSGGRNESGRKPLGLLPAAAERIGSGSGVSRASEKRGPCPPRRPRAGTDRRAPLLALVIERAYHVAQLVRLRSPNRDPRSERESE